MIEYSQKFLKRRKFLTVLPVIVVPFVTIVFWLLGGGSGAATVVQTKTGLNTQLPDANLKSQSALDKLSFYAMADRDSVKKEEAMRMDPNYSTSVVEPVEKRPSVQRQNEEPAYKEEPKQKAVVDNSGEIERLQVMMQSMSQRKSDPEMDAINSTLEKLLDVQHPERVKEKLVEKKGLEYAVSTISDSVDDHFFGREATNKGAFYSSDYVNDATNIPGLIPAVIHGSQNLQNGFVIKLRLLKDVFVKGSRIEAGTFVYGTTHFEEERMKVEINSIQFEKNLYPVALDVYDMDGIKGIYIPGSATREVVKQSGDQSLQSIGIVSMDPSLKAQATAAGIGAAKSLLTRKVKQVRVSVKANYLVLLKDANQK